MQTHAHLREVLDALFQTTSEKVTAAVAWGAILSPWWLPTAHDLAAQWAPVLGCAWLIVQILDKLIRLSRDDNKGDDDGGEE
jgi:hypothetical protein